MYIVKRYKIVSLNPSISENVATSLTPERTVEKEGWKERSRSCTYNDNGALYRCQMSFVRLRERAAQIIGRPVSERSINGFRARSAIFSSPFPLSVDNRMPLAHLTNQERLSVNMIPLFSNAPSSFPISSVSRYSYFIYTYY